MDPLPIEDRLELALAQFTAEMVANQIHQSNHVPVAQRVLDVHAVSAADRAQLEALFYTRVSRTTKRVPESKLVEPVIHLNGPRIVTHVRLSDSVIDRALSSGAISERPVYKPFELPEPGWPEW